MEKLIKLIKQGKLLEEGKKYEMWESCIALSVTDLIELGVLK